MAVITKGVYFHFRHKIRARRLLFDMCMPPPRFCCQQFGDEADAKLISKLCQVRCGGFCNQLFGFGFSVQIECEILTAGACEDKDVPSFTRIYMCIYLFVVYVATL
jgi:hypothetical protein